MVKLMTSVIAVVSVNPHNRLSEAKVIEFWYFQCKGKSVFTVFITWVIKIWDVVRNFLEFA